MTLGFEVKLFDSLAVVDCLGIDLLIAEDHTLPNRLVGLLKVDVEELAVFNVPERVIHFDLLAKLTIDQWLTLLSLQSDLQMLSLNLHHQLLRLGALRNLNLQINVLDALRPIVVLSLSSVVRANLLVYLYFGARLDHSFLAVVLLLDWSLLKWQGGVQVYFLRLFFLFLFFRRFFGLFTFGFGALLFG